MNDVCHQQIDPVIFDVSTNAYEVGPDYVSIYPNPMPNQLKVEGALGVADIRIDSALGELMENLNGLISPILIDLS